MTGDVRFGARRERVISPRVNRASLSTESELIGEIGVSR